MTISAAIAIYFIIWWLTLFAVLPFGIRSQRETGEVVPGSDPGAPAKVNGLRIIAITSAVSAVLFALFWLVYVRNVLELEIIREITRS
jgi:predicted secreted protein